MGLEFGLGAAVAGSRDWTLVNWRTQAMPMMGQLEWKRGFRDNRNTDYEVRMEDADPS